MNAIERIQAAIDKLTAFKAQPKPPFLVSFDPETMGDGDNDDIVSTAFNAGSDWGVWAERNQMADAQLAILNDGLIVAKHWEDILEKLSGSVRIPITHALLFADAILGPDPH